MGCQFSADQSESENCRDKSVNDASGQRMQHELSNSAQTLMTIAREDECCLLSYNFREKKWYPRQLISNFSNILIDDQSASLNGQLYGINSLHHNSFLLFNPKDKKTKMLHSSSGILDHYAMCSCNKFIYFCGGGFPGTDQCLRYEPQSDFFATLPPMPTRRHNAAVIFHQGCLYVLGGASFESFTTVEKYNPETNEWTSVASMCESRLCHAVVALEDKIYACGGVGKNSAEVYDPSTNSWQLIASMNQQRSSFKVFAYEGKLFAVGGDNFGGPSVEVYDPSRNFWQMDRPMSAGIQGCTIYTSFVIQAN